MFPQHLQTIFLTVLSLLMGGYISGPVAPLESLGPAVLEWELSKVVAAAAPSPTLVSKPTTPSALQQEGMPGLQAPVAFLGPGTPAGAGPRQSGGQQTSAASESLVPSTGFSPESLDYLTEIAFGVEYGESSQVLHKWTEDVRIKVHGTPTRADQETLGQVISELNGLLTDVYLQVTDGDSNLEIYFLPEPQFASVEPEYVPVNLGFFRVWWDGTGAINQARVLIDSQGITQQERSHLIREELTQSLGLFKDSWRYPDSMFYQGWTDITSYSDLDRATIRLLYSSQLTPEMTQNQALKALGANSSDLCCRD